MYACLHSPQEHILLDWAERFAPYPEQVDACTVVLDLRGQRLLWPSLEEFGQTVQAGKPALRVAIAPQRLVALAIACHCEGLHVIQVGEEAAYLGMLPAAALPVSAETHAVLDSWGVRTIEDFVSLPDQGVIERLGAEGRRALAWAKGQAGQVLVPTIREKVFRQQWRWEEGVDSLEPLWFLLSRLLHDLCSELRDQALATNEVHLSLGLEDGHTHASTLQLVVATVQADSLFRLFKLRLEQNPPPGTVMELLLTARPSPRRSTQNRLWASPQLAPDGLALTLARLAALVGPDSFGTPVLQDTHRPDAFQLARFGAGHLEGKADRRECQPYPRLVLRRFRPPLTAAVQTKGGEPVYVVARTVQGAVLCAAGPWRSAGNWWLPTAWSASVWDVALQDGTLCRLVQFRADHWVVEGYYD